MSIPESFINELLGKVDIVTLINSRHALRKAGANFVAVCPFHTEKTPSFSVSSTKQFYHCFGCGVSGDAIQFLIEFEGINFVEAIETLAELEGMVVPKSQNNHANVPHTDILQALDKAAKYYQIQLRTHPMASTAVNYLKSRGITGKTAKEFSLGLAPPGWNNLLKNLGTDTTAISDLQNAGLVICKNDTRYYDRFRARIIFPIRNRKGQIIAFGARVLDHSQPKYLNSPETEVFSKGQELYGLYEAKRKLKHLKSLIIVEGYMDVLTLFQANICNVVATLGTALTSKHLTKLFQLVPEIIICFDGDKAGHLAASRVLEICLPLMKDELQIKFLLLPENNDPDSYVQKFGAKEFLKQTSKASPLSDFIFNQILKKIDLEHIDGRVILANEAKVLINRLPDGIFKHMMYARLARLVGLDQSVLQGTISTNITSNKLVGLRRNNLKRSLPTPPISPAMCAAAILLDNRQLIDELEDISELNSVQLHACKFFCAFVKVLQESPSATENEIQDRLPANLAKSFIPEELRCITRFIPESGIEQEFHGAVQRLRQLAQEQAMDLLLSKAKVDTLTAKEKDLLQKMFIAKGKSVD
jgi:DNA primase